MNNPFKFSDDNKRYLTFNYYGKHKYGKKLYKVPLDAGFSCPNRDGSISSTGCLYCANGSNSFPSLSSQDIKQQYQDRIKIFQNKWDGYPMAYFQSYSNSYGPIERLKEIYQPFVDDENVYGIVIATRSDCLDKEKIAYINSLTAKKEIWLELGLQSTHDQTLKEMNRGHDYQNFLDCIALLKDTNIKISVHLINGWPSETKEMMLQTAKKIAKLPIHAVKFHMLHVCKSTPLGQQYLKHPFKLLSKEEYVNIVALQISYLREDIIIERLTGDSLLDELIEPKWTVKKVSVINDIDKEMVKNNLYQACNYKE